LSETSLQDWRDTWVDTFAAGRSPYVKYWALLYLCHNPW